jgi:hypothetical protein
MIMPEPAEAATEIEPLGLSLEKAPMSVHLEEVSKVYRLYGNPREQVLDSLGLNRFVPRRRRHTFQEFHALKSINLTVRRGERIGIIGRNGAGKTTLLKLITGNFLPTSGQVEVNGSVQALMQMGLGFHPEFSGYENMRAALNYNGLIGADFEEALADVIDFVELLRGSVGRRDRFRRTGRVLAPADENLLAGHAGASAIRGGYRDPSRHLDHRRGHGRGRRLFRG